MRANPIFTLSLNSNIVYGATLPPPGFPYPDEETCDLAPCAIFTGTLTLYGDPDLPTGYFTEVGMPYVTDNFGGSYFLSMDFLGPPIDLSLPVVGAPPAVYVGPIFKVVVAPEAPAGAYTDTVYIPVSDFSYTPYPGFNTTVLSETVTVVVEPEPPSLLLLFAGLTSCALSAKKKFSDISPGRR